MWDYRRLNYNVNPWSCFVSQSREKANIITEMNDARNLICSLLRVFTIKCIKSVHY
jgi:hypothetical protein